jgi:MFS superfamily sulfate permease-like transporter
MTIDPTAYYILVGFIVILSSVLVGVSISYFLSFRKLSRLQEKESEIVNAAQDQAEKIIGQAVQIHYASENKINRAAEKLTEDETKELTEKSAEFIKMFDGKIAELNNQNIESFKNISDELVKSVNLHFEELKTLLSRQTVESQKAAEDKIKGEYDKMEQELETYKKEQMEKINNNIYQILLNISKEVFGKKLDTKEHEEMIAKALAEAEKQMN